MQKNQLYRDLRNDYYIGCFAQTKEPQEFYKDIINNLEDKEQSPTEMFNLLKIMSNQSPDNLPKGFTIPLKLIPEFDIGTYNYIYKTKESKIELYLPDVGISMNSINLIAKDGIYIIDIISESSILKIKYNNMVYSIIVIRG